MRKWLFEEEIQKKIYTYTITGILIVLFFFLIKEISVVSAFIKNLLAILSPFIWGIGFAFLLMPLAKRLEKIFPEKMGHRFKRTMVAIICILVLLLLLALFFAILFPQLFASIGQLSVVIGGFIKDASLWIESISSEFHLSEEFIKDIYEIFKQNIQSFVSFVQQSLPNVIETTMSTFTGLGNFVIGIIVALYILIDRDHLHRQLSKLSMALFSKKHHDRLSNVMRLSIEKFTSFFMGKVIDSAIIGVLCFVTMTLLHLDYAMLISFIVGVTNIIPFFGPFIGAIPSIFILLIVDPMQAIWFFFLILILQQLDGNLIGPTILGDSMGLSSLWIMFAIIVGGAYFGVIGMVVGVPVFAIFYYLVREFVENRLKEKGIEYPNKDL